MDPESDFYNLPLGTCWLQVSLKDAASKKLIRDFVESHLTDSVQRHAAIGGGIKPHMTLLYIGKCSQRLNVHIQAAAQEFKLAEKLRELVQPKPGTFGLEMLDEPLEKQIVLRFCTQNDAAIRQIMCEFFAFLHSRNAFEGLAPAVDPNVRQLLPHVTLFEHDTEANAIAHFDDLVLRDSSRELVSALQNVTFGPVQLIIRVKMRGCDPPPRTIPFHTL